MTMRLDKWSVVVGFQFSSLEWTLDTSRRLWSLMYIMLAKSIAHGRVLERLIVSVGVKTGIIEYPMKSKSIISHVSWLQTNSERIGCRGFLCFSPKSCPSA